MEPETIIALTRQQIPELNGSSVSVEEIAKGGSNRRYFRVRTSGISLIFCQYSADAPENSRFAQHTDFLSANHVPVPRILARDAENRRLWIQDLGEKDLWYFRNEDWLIRGPLYQKTLRMVGRIHQLRQNAGTHPLDLGPEFNEGMYAWEQDYFFENFVANFSAASPEEAGRVRRSPELATLKKELSQPPRCLIHRDFQSQNVIILEGEPVFIDYQGLRFGLPEYDLASLIYDPYAPMKEEQREELIAFAAVRSANPDFRHQFQRCACQRLMQALGAYGFLGLVKGKSAFLDHIEPALANLRTVALDRGALPVLEPVLRTVTP